MVAYNHTLKFIPPLANEKSVSSSYADTITVREKASQTKTKKLSYKLNFFNNQGRDNALYTDKRFTQTEQGQLWAFKIEGVVTFYWQSGSLILEYVKHENFTETLLVYWYLHIVLPVFFTIEETYDFLHAGAVEVEGKPILFVAESFGGKSTMTDFFMKQGHTMVSDDKVGSFENDGLFYAVPSHPHHRPHRGMEDLGFFVENVAKVPKPIHAIYELEKSDANAEVEIVALHGIEKFKTLRYSSEINLSFLKAKRFRFLSRLAKMVPVYKVKVPWDLERLNEVHKKIVAHSIL